MARWLTGGAFKSGRSRTATGSRSAATSSNSARIEDSPQSRRREGSIFELTAEVLIFLLRVLLLAVLYLFLLLVLLAIRNDVTRATAARPARAARLIVLSSGQSDLEPGEALELAETTSIGRSEGNRVVLRDTFVSGEHAVIRYADDGWWLEDRDSTNGTLLNDRVVDGPIALGNGDVISIGQIRLRVVV